MTSAREIVIVDEEEFEREIIIVEDEEECCNCWKFADDGCKCDCHSDADEEDEEEEEEIFACKCGEPCSKNNLCGHKINAGVCCDCEDCLAELEEDEEEELISNETDETCPICLEAYDREIGRLKDGIQNSNYESNCPHWCCCMCWDTMSRQDNDTYSCPICKTDITDWLKTHYYSDSDDEEE